MVVPVDDHVNWGILFECTPGISLDRIVQMHGRSEAHGLLVSATQLAGNAARIRREAALTANMTRAWDASSAAAGSLMLSAKAQTDMQNLFRSPQLPR